MQFSDFDLEKMTRLFGRHRRPKIMVIGDYCLDKYLYRLLEWDEPSVETGLTAYQIRDVRIYPGVGGTVTANLSALGAKVYCAGIRGDDGEGYELQTALKQCGANTRGLFVSDQIRTNTYMKPMVQEGNGWKEMNRLDLRNAKPAPKELVQRVADYFEEQLPQMDGAIVSDQFTHEAGSVVTDMLRRVIGRVAAANPEKPILVDSRSSCGSWRNVMVKCNASELLAWRTGNDQAKTVNVDATADQKEDELRESGMRLAKRNRRPVLVTRGELGSLLFYRNEEEKKIVCREIPAVRVMPPIDICGAGDATNAGFVFAKSSGATWEESAFLAGLVSSITIQKIGVTGTASPAEIKTLLDRLANESTKDGKVR